MNIIDAWKQAKEKQEIEKRTFPKCSVKKMLTMADFTEWLSSVCPSGAILADDWEVVKEKRKQVFEVWRIRGECDSTCFNWSCYPRDAKVTIEWEEYK
jgi:hypothetical protein